MVEECPGCRREFERVGTHWSANPDHVPKLTDRQKSILDGWMLGDGSYVNGAVVMKNTNREFLEWTKNELGVIANDITLDRPSGEMLVDFPHSKNRVTECKDLYALRVNTQASPNKYWDWYNKTGKQNKKKLPGEYELDPVSLKIWYCCDGQLDNNGRRFLIQMANMNFSREGLVSLFNDIGFSPTSNINGVRFGMDDTKELLEWIGEPPNGMGYKWGYKDEQ